MATDIAFAVGVLALLGKRVPAALRVLLLAVAVIDDLGAILVIAIFYSSEFSVSGLLTAAGGISGVFLMQWLGVRAKLLYVVPSVIAWGGIYAAGVHPTIAGVIVGMITPVRAWLGTEGFRHVVRRKLDDLADSKTGAMPTQEVAEALRDVSLAKREALSPAESLIATLHPWVAFVIMPIFALANAGVTLPAGSLDSASWSVAVAVTVGLVAGKPLGVLLASWVVLRLRIGTLPIGVGYRHLLVLGVVAGIGFTMALFIAQLAFADDGLLAAAKLGILAASGGAAIIGLLLGRLLLSPEAIEGAAQTADEAERSTQS